MGGAIVVDVTVVMGVAAVMGGAIVVGGAVVMGGVVEACVAFVVDPCMQCYQTFRLCYQIFHASMHAYTLLYIHIIIYHALTDHDHCMHVCVFMCVCVCVHLRSHHPEISVQFSAMVTDAAGMAPTTATMTPEPVSRHI